MSEPAPCLLKGIEEEVYTGSPDGPIVGVMNRVKKDLPYLATEPDCRNPEFSLPPLRGYDEIGTTLMQTRASLRERIGTVGDYTLVPGSTMSCGDSTEFLISDPNNEYYRYIRDTYGTRVVTTSTHISIGVDDAETIVRAARVMRSEACLFLALTATSPFLDGKATGYHSTRWAMFPETPSDTPLFSSHEDYRKFVAGAIADGRMQNSRHLWVSARPNGSAVPEDLNRVELRICDHIADPRVLLAVVALFEARIRQVIADPTNDPVHNSQLSKSGRAETLVEIVKENEAAVAKDSLEATVRHPLNGQQMPIRKWLEEYIEQAMATAIDNGFDQVLGPLKSIVEYGNPAMRWLREHEKGTSVGEIIRNAIVHMEATESEYLAEIPTRQLSLCDQPLAL